MIWAYLWHAEHGLLLLWLAAAVFVVCGITPDSPRRTAAVWLAAAACVYLALAIGSSSMHRFAVTAHDARQLVPFLCLAAAAAVTELLECRRRLGWLGALCVVALVAQVAWNFHQPLQQRFPRDVIAEMTAEYGPVDHDLTLTGSTLADGHVESQWVLLNGQHLDHPRVPRPPLPTGIIEVARFPHPLQFVPYQYEGFTPTERQLLRSNDIAMRLIDIGAPVDAPP